MYTDPVADFLTRIRNAIKARHSKVEIPASKEKESIAKVLVDSGFIESVERVEGYGPQGKLVVKLRYYKGDPAVVKIQRVSRPGLRKYFKCSEIPEVLNGMGVSVLSTSQGIMTNKEALKKGLGGELMFFVY